MKSYNHQVVEKKWQKRWEEQGLYTTPDRIADRDNYYCLFEFPYPSGNLHMGHWYTFAVPDIFVRSMRMQGKYNVMYPIGFDAFGLPAENAAIKHDLQPSDWTYKNITHMTSQLKNMGTALDWSRQVITSDPEYYKWTQWLFLQFYKKGFVYRSKTPVNWCPKDQTVLANEQVVTKIQDGREINVCDRCGTEVEKKNLEQWMFKITAYADRLVDDLQKLDWPESTKSAQINWIGRSEGAEIDFAIEGSDEKITVFTTRADTIFGATYVVLAPDAPLAASLLARVANRMEVEKYIEEVKAKTERERLVDAKEKTGIVLEGIYVMNPANDERIPVWIADYVLSSYGTGAVMAVPAHDERDFAFAKKYKLEEKLVIIQPAPLHGSQELRPYTGEGYLTNSEKYNSLPSWEARKAIVLQLEKEGKAKFKKNYRLHDWILSRQRYWGCPIPMIHCADCGYVPVPEQDLPVILPRLEDYRPAEDGRSPLAKAHEWVEVKCPQCGKDAQRETDTMDTFVDSSWYFLRYTDPQNQDVIADSEKANVWLPVQKYIGGAEHNTMHLLYARFFTKAMNDCGIVDFDEPFLSRVNHGVILGPDGQKMSKSKGNVIDPDELVKEYGADVVRMYLAFMAPYEQGGPWDPKGIKGVARFLDRAWKFAHEYEKIQDGSQHSRPILHNAIKQLGEDIANFHFNTCVSELMKLINHLEVSVVDREVVEIFVKLLAPFAPHMAEELWQNVLEHADSVHIQLWPEYKEELLQENEVSIVVQINGKPRAVIGVPFGAEQDRVGEIARKDEKAIKYLEGTTIAKEIFVKNKLINFVIQKEGESK